MGSEHVDIIVVGAGLSGIGAACHLARRMPSRSVAILEARDRMGGTWDLFRYPGVRSDSDMYTLGYAFEPWTHADSIASGSVILEYIAETARKYGVDRRIRYRSKVVAARWSTAQSLWTVEIEDPDTGHRSTMTCRFLYGCTGYYRYDHGYTPDIPGLGDFAGAVVHPQHWPTDLDVTGRRVVVVGSGATAVTLVPALAAKAGHVTMLQRSPTHILPMPAKDPIADRLRAGLPQPVAYGMVRWKNILWSQLSFQLSQRRPEGVRRFIRDQQRPLLPHGFDFDTHLNPDYRPWDQRLCLAADGDLFAAIREGRADIVTDTITRVRDTGIELSSGRTLAADIVVLATGLTLLPMGGIRLHVDEARVDLPERVAYKGAMLSGVPNFVFTVGYTNASWTLKADLVADYFCRLVRHMERNGYVMALPVAPPADEPRSPIMELKAGYIRRSEGDLPSQGSRRPWRLRQNYPFDLVTLRYGRIQDEGLRLYRRAEVRPHALAETG
ncbi:MAG: NAD(P)/FAD-dependent oxidoreductase [Candidatus Nanopelagicales bacterium]